MNTPNLHSTLSVITIAKLKAYLADEGWKESIADGRLNFIKEFEPGDSRTVFVPAEQTHPKFRSLLQNLMFNLAVTQNREPADIAYDISTFQISEAAQVAKTPQVAETPRFVEIGGQLHEIASIVRGLAKECNPTEQAKGRILELVRFLLGPQSFSAILTPQMAEELWEITRSDHSYLPTATSEWIESKARETASK